MSQNLRKISVPKDIVIVKGFMDYVRTQGVIGLATGFVLGGAVTKVVTSLVNDIINPLLGIILGAAGDLKSAHLQVGQAKIMWGNFVSTTIDFVVIATVVYIIVKKIGLEKIDKKKE